VDIRLSAPLHSSTFGDYPRYVNFVFFCLGVLGGYKVVSPPCTAAPSVIILATLILCFVYHCMVDCWMFLFGKAILRSLDDQLVIAGALLIDTIR